MTEHFPDICSFLDEAPTSWHTTELLASFLSKQGYKALDERKRFTVAAGNAYFLKKGGSLFTFSLPKKSVKKLLIFTTHTDSPTFQLKRHPDSPTHDMNTLLVEAYGSPLKRTWVDRDLFLAGRVFTSKNGVAKEQLVSFEEYPFTIPSLAVHLDRDQKAPENKQLHMRPLFSIEKNHTVESLLREKMKGQTVHSYELFLIPYEPARILNSELVSSYRLDNLASVHATVEGLLQAKVSEDTLVCHAMFNHEEIGSATPEGGVSSTLDTLLKRISYALHDSELPLHEWKANALGVSIDMAHALHPNHLDKYDVQNSPLLGRGPAIKYNACKRYATSAYSASVIEMTAKKHKIPLQSFTIHSDGSCGSTIGHLLSHTFGIEVVDIGIPQLAMHSARELMALKDHYSLSQLVRHLV